jgi:predicted dehydrogenase
MRLSRGGGDIPEKIRLGLIDACVTGTWSARAPAGIAGELGFRADGGLHDPGESAEAGPRLGRPADDRRLRKMVASPQIDAIAVVVHVPSHYPPTKAALEAGNTALCNGRTSAVIGDKCQASLRAHADAGPKRFR